MSYYVEKRGANHGLHLALTVLTFGMWAPIWFLCSLVGRKTTTYGPNLQQAVWLPPVPAQTLQDVPRTFCSRCNGYYPMGHGHG